MDTNNDLYRRSKESEGLVNYLEALGDVPVIFAGDLNSLSPVDVADPDLEPWEDDLGTEPCEKLLEAGYYDVYRTINPKEPGYTYPRYDSRIDFCFVSPHVMDDITTSELVKSHAAMTTSDHLPLTFTIDQFDLDKYVPPETTASSDTASSTSSTGTDTAVAGFQLLFIAAIPAARRKKRKKR